MNPELNKRITIDPRIMVGKPVITGTRIPVYQVLRMVAEELSIDAILEEYPRLTRDDIRAALHYGAAVLELEDVFPVTTSEPVPVP